MTGSCTDRYTTQEDIRPFFYKYISKTFVFPLRAATPPLGRMASPPPTPPSRCESLKEKALKSMHVKFVRDKMQELGCDTYATEHFSFACEPCFDAAVVGRFDASGRRLLLCSDNIEKYKLSDAHVLRTVLHELIHAYDMCRVQLDPLDCSHIACTEIRAAHLSGDCDFFTELERRNLGFKSQGAACAKRRALLSVRAHPNCQGDKAEEAVNQVFDLCMKDTSPFIRKC